MENVCALQKFMAHNKNTRRITTLMGSWNPETGSRNPKQEQCILPASILTMVQN